MRTNPQIDPLMRAGGVDAECLDHTGHSECVHALTKLWYRMATNKIITIAIITVLVLLIIAVIFSKFRK